MKHISTFKLFESYPLVESVSSDLNLMKDDIEDILIELSDHGFEPDIYPETHTSTDGYIHIHLRRLPGYGVTYGKHALFCSDSPIDNGFNMIYIIKHLSSYVSEYGYTVKLYYDGKYLSLDDILYGYSYSPRWVNCLIKLEKNKQNESIFDVFKKQEDAFKRYVDKDVLKDLLESDLEGMSRFGINILDNSEIIPSYYKGDRNGPILKKTTWFGKKIQYASPDDVKGNFPFSHMRKDSFGFVLKKKQDPELDIRESFEFGYYIYDNINYKRMQQYGIGYCLFNLYNYSDILFYPL